MENILGIDVGKKKVGIARSFGSLAEPHGVVSRSLALDTIKKIVKREEIGKIVVGISEGKSARDAGEFAQMIRREIKLPVVLWDETLTTQEAIQKAIEAGLPRRKRKGLEDAFAATIMLQSYLDGRGGLV